MQNFASIARLFAVATLANVFIVSAASAGQQVRVKFTDDTVVVAELDKRTNHDRLVLRFTGEACILLRAVVWNRVVAMEPINGSTSFVPPSGSKATPAIAAEQRSFAQRAADALSGVALAGLSSSEHNDADALGFSVPERRGCTASTAQPTTTMTAQFSQTPPIVLGTRSLCTTGLSKNL